MAMLLEWLGLPETKRGAWAVRKAVTEVLAAPQNRTKDLGGRLTTREMGDLVETAVTRLLTAE
jgi:isocitrate/isopropylmalate dehydrogenase